MKLNSITCALLKEPAFAVRIHEAILEIEGDEPVAMGGPDGLVTEPDTDCGPDPFGLSVRHLQGRPDLCVIETEERGGWGITDTRPLFFVLSGAIETPKSNCNSTAAGLGCDCRSNALRYSYGDGLLTLIDEEMKTWAIGEPPGHCNCARNDATLKGCRVDVSTGVQWLDKWVYVRDPTPEDYCEDPEDEIEDGERADGASDDGARGWVAPSLRPLLFDDGLSGWLFVPVNLEERVLRINQRPEDAALRIQLAEPPPDGAPGSIVANSYNEPDTPAQGRLLALQPHREPQALSAADLLTGAQARSLVANRRSALSGRSLSRRRGSDHRERECRQRW